MSEFYQSLIGKRVLSLAIDIDEYAIKFITDSGDVVWSAIGDCCSTSWWADGYDLDTLRDATVLNIKELSYYDPGQDGRNRQEQDWVYGFCIGTTKGAAYLAFRNSSNGYYGGYAEEGGYTDDNKWRPLNENDWSA